MRKTIAQMGADSKREDYENWTSLKEELLYLETMIEKQESYGDRIAKECNLGRRFASRTFSSFTPDGNELAFYKAANYAGRFKTVKGEGLIFMGRAGTGKTHLAAAIINHLVHKKCIPAMFVTAVELFGLLRDFDNQGERLRRIKSVPLLVLDDLGKEKITDWNREKLFEIINARYEDYLPIIITTNDTPAELERNVGKAIYSRLCEMCDLIVMGGRDYRRQA